MGKVENLEKKIFVTAYYKRDQKDDYVIRTQLVPNLSLENVEEPEPGTLRSCYFFIADAIQDGENVSPSTEYYRGPNVIFGKVYRNEEACVLFGVQRGGVYGDIRAGARMFCVKNDGELPIPVLSNEVTEDEYEGILRCHQDKINKIVKATNGGCVTNGRSYAQSHQLLGASG